MLLGWYKRFHLNSLCVIVQIAPTLLSPLPTPSAENFMRKKSDSPVWVLPSNAPPVYPPTNCTPTANWRVAASTGRRTEQTICFWENYTLISYPTKKSKTHVQVIAGSSQKNVANSVNVQCARIVPRTSTPCLCPKQFARIVKLGEEHVQSCPRWHSGPGIQMYILRYGEKMWKAFASTVVHKCSKYVDETQTPKTNEQSRSTKLA